MNRLDKYFQKYRADIIGDEQVFSTPYGEKKILYADWVASGRLYAPIENRLLNTFGPYVGNTHTETSVTGTSMTLAYHLAHDKIKQHVNANQNDIIITAGFGMTTVVNKFQRILGIKAPCQLTSNLHIDAEDRPVVFITHMEHHSNQTSWQETIADVVVIPPTAEGLVDLEWFSNEIKKYSIRKMKIGSFSAGSNVTGILPPFHKLARIMHEHDGVCFVDFAASAPYINMDMHPQDPMEKLDAVMFSPHKFLGGPGTSGVLIFDKALYQSGIPDHPGGGTVDWTNPWGGHKYLEDIEAREDGGTPGFLQAIRTALCLELKNDMKVENILAREKELLEIAFPRLRSIPKLQILAGNIEERIGIISFYIEDIHFNLLVKLLNDLYGIQVRGGCSCAGTYGHYLLHIGPGVSKRITDKISHGDLSAKPGWVRLSLHPTLSDEELGIILDGIEEIAANIETLRKDYIYSEHTNEFTHKSYVDTLSQSIGDWFKL